MQRPLERVDAVWAGGVTVAAALLFATTLSSHVALGDAPESVSGVRSVGILHSPGYPTYVLLGRLWAAAVPVGSWAARLNVFSLVCSAVTIGLVFLLARLFDAERSAAVIGAFVLATSTAFWFNAGFAKYYALAALLVTAQAVLGLWWLRGGATSLLVCAAMFAGLGLGASWQSTGIITLGLVVLVAAGDRRPPARTLGLVVAAAGATGLALCTFIVVRAGQDPAINFGRATGVGRLADLLRDKDFSTGSDAQTRVHSLREVPHRALSYGVITAREVGVCAVVVAIFGVATLFRDRRRAEAWFFVTVAVANLLAVVFVSGLNVENGISSGIAVAGYLIDLCIVLAVLVGVGATAAAGLAARGRRARGPTFARTAQLVVIAIVGVTVLAPSLVVHPSYASHRGPAFADNYGHRVLASLPRNALLVVWGWEYAQPMWYRQIVVHERPDVTVVDGSDLVLAWYREEVARNLGSLVPDRQQANAPYVVELIGNALAQRPVFVDVSAMQVLIGAFRLQVDGLVAQVSPGSNALATRRPLAQAVADLHGAQEADGMFDSGVRHFPNGLVSGLEVTADLIVAYAAVVAGSYEAARAELTDAIRIRPDVGDLGRALTRVEQRDPSVASDLATLAGIA